MAPKINSLLGGTNSFCSDEIKFSVKIDSYSRSFIAKVSSSKIEEALQQIYILFTQKVKATEEEKLAVMEILETNQDTFTYFNNYAKKLNGGESYFMKGGIPMPTEPVIRFQRDNLTLIPFNFPPAPVREEICRPVAGSKCCTKVTFPVNLSNLNMDEDEFVLDILWALIRIVVLGRLRHVEGQIYEVLVEQSHDGYNFASAGLTNSSITVEFLSSENTSYLLADAVVDEILQLQKEGPSQNDMLAVFGAMDGVNKNLAWCCDEIIGSYRAFPFDPKKKYRGILDDAYEARGNMRKNVRQCMSVVVLKCAFQRMLLYPCKERFTAVVLKPEK